MTKEQIATFATRALLGRYELALEQYYSWKEAYTYIHSADPTSNYLVHAAKRLQAAEGTKLAIMAELNKREDL